MDKKAVTRFFDSLAESWDDNMIRDQRKIDKILDIAEVTDGKRVLDVACGTGVLIPDYINRNVSECVAVDISQRMIDIAESKFGKYESVELLCADAENHEFSRTFDSVIIYNAFPHFVNPDKLFANLSKCIEYSGRFTVAHSMSREDLIRHHSGRAAEVSVILPEAESLAEIMGPYFEVDTKLSTDEIYIVSGKKVNRQ